VPARAGFAGTRRFSAPGSATRPPPWLRQRRYQSRSSFAVVARITPPRPAPPRA